jgi:hypothetical protein
MAKDIKSCLTVSQKAEVRKYGDHDYKMMLLGKRMKSRLNRKQQKSIDLAVEIALEAIDDYRTESKGLNPMCGRTYTRPPEESMQQAALW